MLKYPLPGKVKARLAMDLGGEKSALLYSCFVSTLLATCQRLGREVLICCHPDQMIEDYQAWLGNSYKYIVQGRGDLGRKMEDAFHQAFELGYLKVVLTGSDLPHLPLHYLQAAFDRLEDVRCVLGPAMDGGYYLVGMNRGDFIPEIFRHIPWSTSGVMDLTLEVLQGLEVEVFILPELYDIDNIRDLRKLLHSHGYNTESNEDLEHAVAGYLKDCLRH